VNISADLTSLLFVLLGRSATFAAQVLLLLARLTNKEPPLPLR